MKARSICRPAFRRNVALAITVLVVPLAGLGCADANYDRLLLGQAPSDYERTLPQDQTRRTQIGLATLLDDPGRTDAIVVMLTADRRIAGKIQATYFEKSWTQPSAGFRLRGELDPQLSEMRGTGTIDTLRVIAGELVNYEGEKTATEAHAWVATGLARLIERWPNVEDAGVDTQRLMDYLDRIPGGGVARLTLDPRGVYRFEYEQGRTP